MGSVQKDIQPRRISGLGLNSKHETFNHTYLYSSQRQKRVEILSKHLPSNQLTRPGHGVLVAVNVTQSVFLLFRTLKKILFFSGKPITPWMEIVCHSNMDKVRGDPADFSTLIKKKIANPHANPSPNSLNFSMKNLTNGNISNSRLHTKSPSAVPPSTKNIGVGTAGRHSSHPPVPLGHGHLGSIHGPASVSISVGHSNANGLSLSPGSSSSSAAPSPVPTPSNSGESKSFKFPSYPKKMVTTNFFWISSSSLYCILFPITAKDLMLLIMHSLLAHCCLVLVSHNLRMTCPYPFLG